MADRVGAKYLVPLLGVYDRLQPSDFQPLPKRFIIKANHGSNWNRIVWDKNALNIRETIRYFNGRLRRNYGARSGELHYGLIPPKILIEDLLLIDGQLPCDYRIYCYHGARGFDYSIGIRSSCREKRADFDRHWNLWESSFPEEEERLWTKPRNFDEMIHVARELSRDFDFIRVDFYDVGGRIYFGELTCTPGAGTTPIGNEFRAAKRTEMWDLDIDNPSLYHRRAG